MGQEADVAYYDQLHRDPGTYDLPVRQSPYYPLFRKIVAVIAARGCKRVLEVGCGSGALAELIMASTGADYRGFDFSPTAVAKAHARTGRDVFAVGDATDPASYTPPGYPDYDVVVCTEVLEHITADKAVIGLWRPGVPCLCSVPNFDYEGHVRFFRAEAEVRARYDDVIAIAGVERIAKPVRAGMTLRDYLRKLRWSRDDPRRFMGLLGVGTFDAIGGWFLFDGVTRR
jgi:2-polyprenyl-3-methyl-5-hydroxy-6-metoxy-1,4-benzoquinol methylase